MSISRRAWMARGLSLPAAGLIPTAVAGAARPSNLAAAGWVWEGQGLDGGVDPSIFGVGEGARYFGLKRAVYMFHPNDDLAMEKMRGLDEVVCDISKWKFRRAEQDPNRKGLVPAVRAYQDGRIATVREEAGKVARLADAYRNLTGGFHDDLLGLIRKEKITPGQYAEVHRALKANPRLKLWTVVYTHELDRSRWEGFVPFMDVINLWVWNAKDLPNLDRYVDQCREVFPGKPINLGCYLRDYPAVSPVPLDLLRVQWEHVLKYVQAGTITGYSILAACLIDGQREQAAWVRDFIARN